MSDPTVENLIQCPVHGPVTPNRHHIVPSSRGGKNKDNVNKKTCPLCHEPYHWLFSNMTPPEIIAYLVKNFWDGQLRWVHVFLEEYGENGGDGWPENQANWSPHLAEAQLRQILEGERQLRDAMRSHGLGRGDLILINERTKKIVRWVKKDQGKTQQELLETLLDGEELGPDESIRPVVWKTLPSAD